MPEISETVKGSFTMFFGTVRLKIFDGKSWYSPFLSINFLATGNFLKHSTEGFPYEIFRHCETKNFRRKILILPPPLIQTFSVPEINATVKDFPTEISGTVRQKIFDGKSWYSPPLSINFFATGNFWSTAEKGSPAKFFGTVRQKIFVGKSWHSLPPDSKINLFATGNFLKHSTEGFLYEMFRYCKTKNFRRKIVT